MSRHQPLRIFLAVAVIAHGLLFLNPTALVQASSLGIIEARPTGSQLTLTPPQRSSTSITQLQAEYRPDQIRVVSGAAVRAQQGEPTTLEVSIVSSPYAILDHNDPSGLKKPVPNAYVVAAVVTNTGTITATDLVVALDYNDDATMNWTLLSGEDPDRVLDELAPTQAYHAYWFARYSTVIQSRHQYTVTARAQNASPVATSVNSYGGLLQGSQSRHGPISAPETPASSRSIPMPSL